jgi:hypothetical protein
MKQILFKVAFGEGREFIFCHSNLLLLLNKLIFFSPAFAKLPVVRFFSGFEQPDFHKSLTEINDGLQM